MHERLLIAASIFLCFCSSSAAAGSLEQCLNEVTPGSAERIIAFVESAKELDFMQRTDDDKSNDLTLKAVMAMLQSYHLQVELCRQQQGRR